MFATLLDLLLPVRCLGCAAPGTALCHGCLADGIHLRRHLPSPCPPELPPLWCAGQYSGTLREALLAFKERGQRELAVPLGAALAGAVLRAANGGGSRDAAGDGDLTGSTGAAGTEDRRPVVLVPVPSRRSAVRRRGGDHMLRLAGVAARWLATRGHVVRILPLLTVVGRPRDSAGLSAGQRVRNLAGGFAVHLDGRGADGSLVVLVDDIVTTGATLCEATRTVRGVGLSVAAAAVVAATSRAGPDPSG